MLAITIPLLIHVHNIGALLVVVAINSIFVQLYFGPLFAVGIERFGVEKAGLASGFGNFFANIGGFTFAYTIGVLKDETGSFAVGFYALAGLCVFGLVCVLGLALTPHDRIQTAQPAS